VTFIPAGVTAVAVTVWVAVEVAGTRVVVRVAVCVPPATITMGSNPIETAIPASSRNEGDANVIE